METVVLEKMPDLFWHLISEHRWNNFFLENIPENYPKAKIVIIRTKTIFDRSLFLNFPSLKLIIRAGSGFDNTNIEEATKREILVFNTPEANTQAAFEHTLSFIFALIKNHQYGKKAVIDGSWKDNIPMNLEISDLKILIVGVGRIGTKVATTMKMLGAAVKGVDPYLSEEVRQKKAIEFVEYENGIRWCNMLSFHCPLTIETENYFSLKTLNLFSQPIYIINTARGKILEEFAIKTGINDNKILGFAADVFPEEPWKKKKYAVNLNIYTTPHSASFTENAKNRLAYETIKVWAQYAFGAKQGFNI
ncbi:MAG: hypothetical protein H8E57_08995 [Candidatus Cloacimonetes bacterium]|nr:hypothetical protein [Candidatus Cloacimonadota bacterium]